VYGSQVNPYAHSIASTGAVALLHGSLKLILNVYRGSVTEAANQRLRMQIDPNAKTRSSARNRSGKKGVQISIVVSAVEAVGGFVGSSFCDPLLNAGILLSVFSRRSGSCPVRGSRSTPAFPGNGFS